MKVRFTRKFDYQWPSRAVTCWPEGYEGTVKREVGERAIEKGYAKEIRTRGKRKTDDKRPMGRSADRQADTAGKRAGPVMDDGGHGDDGVHVDSADAGGTSSDSGQ